LEFGVKIMNQNIKKFLGHVTSICLEHNVSLRLEYDDQLVDGDPDEKNPCMVSGYFSEITGQRELAVATKKQTERWLGVLVHEFSHMEQWLEKAKPWARLKSLYSKKGDACQTYFKWVEGKRVEKSIAIRSGKLVRDMELDCEKRAVKNIKKWKLPIPINEYIKNANAYILFYAHTFKHRKWCNIKSPYNIKRIINIMPEEFVDNYDVLEPKYEELVNLYCVI